MRLVISKGAAHLSWVLTVIMYLILISCSQIPTKFIIKTNNTKKETIPTSLSPINITLSNAQLLTQFSYLQQPGSNSFIWLDKGSSVAISTDQQLFYYNVLTSSSTGEVNVAAPILLSSAPTKKLIAWASQEHKIHLWRVDTGEEAFTQDFGEGAVTSLVFSPSEDSLAVALSNGKVSIIHISSKKIIRNWEMVAWLSNLSYSPDGRLIAGTSLAYFVVNFVDTQTGDIIRTLEWLESSSPVLYETVFSPNWDQLAWVARNTVQLMKVENGLLGPSLEHEDFVSAVTWSPDSQIIATAAAGTIDGNFGPVVYLWEATSGKLTRTLALTEPVTEMAFSPDGTTLAILTGNGTLQTWRVLR